MKKTSLWMDTAAAPEFPKLEGDLEVDIVIVGGGITGLTTAHLLKKAGYRIAVIDQGPMGGRETGHTTAHLTFVTDSRLQELVDQSGKKNARALWEAGLQGIKLITEIAAELEVDCELRQVPGYLFAAADKNTSEEMESLKRDALLAEELGFDAIFLETDPVFQRPAVCFPNQWKFHPLKYVSALAKALQEQGSHIFSHTRGSEVDSEKHELQTEDGVIRYHIIVAATHAPVRGERSSWEAALFQTKLAAYSTYAMEAEMDCVPESLFWDTGDPYLYYRFEHQPGNCAVIIGGEDHKTGQEKDTETCYTNLEKSLKRDFPSARPRHRWSGQVLETPDGFPYIGEVAARQYLATGFAGNGMTLGSFSAMMIRDLITGKGHPSENLFSPRRKALPGAGEYLKENKDFPLHFIKSRFRPPASLEDLPPGSGAIVRIEGGKKTVYRDPQGKHLILSPICPHMGCMVDWNAAEKTWDCPCHGSRFTPSGKLLSGPAESDLSPDSP